MTRSRENADGARLDAPLASPVLVTPNLGTPSAGVMTNMTGAVTASLVDNAVTLAKMASGTDGNIISYDASGNPVAIDNFYKHIVCRFIWCNCDYNTSSNFF
jgi:hypothetical protein